MLIQMRYRCIFAICISVFFGGYAVCSFTFVNKLYRYTDVIQIRVLHLYSYRYTDLQIVRSENTDNTDDTDFWLKNQNREEKKERQKNRKSEKTRHYHSFLHHEYASRYHGENNVFPINNRS